jgi:hypothetical protein
MWLNQVLIKDDQVICQLGAERHQIHCISQPYLGFGAPPIKNTWTQRAEGTINRVYINAMNESFFFDNNE